MSACTFFGHRDCPSEIKVKLHEVLIDLIENQAVDMFYVGNNGAFDRLVRAVLRELAQKYAQIQYAVVLERMPTEQDGTAQDTMLPEGIEEVPPRFAISWRNNWMLHKSDFVVCYVTRSWGGAAKFAETAKRRKKTVINIASL